MRLLLLFWLIKVVSSAQIEDLEVVFGNKGCIEASLLSVDSAKTTNIMIEKDTTKNPLNQLTVVNMTQLGLSEHSEKSVMMEINELSQHNELQYSYELISEEGPPHSRQFKVHMTLGNEIYEGVGSSLKKAQRAAAITALENTLYKHPPIKLKEEQIVLTPTVVLNNIAMKMGLAVIYHLVDEDEIKEVQNYSPNDGVAKLKKSYYQKLNQTIYKSKVVKQVPTEDRQKSGPFTVRVNLGENVFVGFGHTIQAAKHDAATTAIKNLEKNVLAKDKICSSEDSVDLCIERKESLKSPITRIYEAGQRHKLTVSFEEISESGKSHNKLFTTRCRLGEFTTEGIGKSKKEAKKIAAERMLGNLSQLPVIIDGKHVIQSLGKKKNKNKKKKVMKTNVEKIGHTIHNLLDSFWGDTQKTENNDEIPKKTGRSLGPKDHILNLSNLLGIEIQFMDVNQAGSGVFSMMSLGVHPLHMCIGKAATKVDSYDNAALHGLKFLQKSGLLDRLQKEDNFKIDYLDFLESDDYVADIVEESPKI